MFQKLFLTHPASVGETYWRHQRVALSFAGSLFLAALACLVHAVIPGLFTRTASRAIDKLQARMTPDGRSAGSRPSRQDVDAPNSRNHILPEPGCVPVSRRRQNSNMGTCHL